MDTLDTVKVYTAYTDVDGRPVLEVAVVNLRVAGQMLSIGRTKLNELCNSKQLDRRHIGRKSVITLASIRAYVAQLSS